jgi:hypothetical protein
MTAHTYTGSQVASMDGQKCELDRLLYSGQLGGEHIIDHDYKWLNYHTTLTSLND